MRQRTLVQFYVSCILSSTQSRNVITNNTRILHLVYAYLDAFSAFYILQRVTSEIHLLLLSKFYLQYSKMEIWSI